MPRACVIVLDGVGAGALPDAAEFGDEGSDTLGNVARAVGGLDLPAMEALGLGNVAPLEGVAQMPGAPAVAGRLLERSKGKDTTLGHWEMMGIVTPQALPTYPHGFPHDVIDPFMHATARGVLGNKPASGTEIIQELGEEHQQTGKWIVYTSADSVFQIAAHEETIPLEELYEGCRKAREILTGKHAVGRVIARPFIGEPGNYERTPNRHDFSLEPRRPNYLTQVREAGAEVHGVGKIPDIFAHLDIDHEHPTKSNVEGITVTEQLLRDIDGGLVFTNLVETDMLWGHRNDPENFHRCLQDFDRRLPDLLEALREGDLLIVTSDHGIDPTTSSTDHSREYGLLLAYVQGKNAAGRIHEGEFGDVGATVNVWLGGKAAPRRLSGVPHPGAVKRLNDPERVRQEYATEDGLVARASIYEGVSGPDAREAAFQAVREAAPRRVLEVGCGWGEFAERMLVELGVDVVAVDLSPRMVELARERGVDARVGDVEALPFEDESFDVTVANWMLYHVPDLEQALSELARVTRPGGRLVAATNSLDHLGELWSLVGRDRHWEPERFFSEDAEAALRECFASVERLDVTGSVTFADREAVRGYIGSSVAHKHLADLVPELSEPLVATRRNSIFVAHK